MQMVASRANEACWSFTAVPDNGYTLEAMRITSKWLSYGTESSDVKWYRDGNDFPPDMTYTSYWDQPIQGLTPDTQTMYEIAELDNHSSTDFVIEMWFTIPDIPIYSPDTGMIQFRDTYSNVPHWYPVPHRT